MLEQYIVALDQGTTSCRAIVYDKELKTIATAQKEFTQLYPQPGWVEHDASEIYATQMGVLKEAILSAGISARQIAGIGITNQRETTVVWNKHTGKPICNAIVWQCRRTADYCEALKEKGLSDYILQNTGLIIDAYFSATKIAWILEHIPNARQAAEKGDLLFGTIDSYLVWKMTDGEAHITDYTNASRTMLYNIRALCWDKSLCDELHIPMSMLPEVRSSSELYGTVNIDGVQVPIAGIAGDQQAALFGQGCFHSGEAKNTYGTGCFLLMNTGEELHISKNGLLTTIAVGLDGKVSYALEGSIFVGGAVIQWLRDQMGLIENAAESELLAAKVPDSAGVYFVPAFTGLGAPYWDMYARGTLCGLTRGTTKHHILRAALEAIAYQSLDVLQAMENDTKIPLRMLKVDGGASVNKLLMQFQSDMLQGSVVCSKNKETTALGAAALAGLAVGVWKDKNQILSLLGQGDRYEPKMAIEERDKKLTQWHHAVKQALCHHDL